MGRRVWFHELVEFFVRRRMVKNGPTLEAFWGAPQDAEEESMLLPARSPRRSIPAVIDAAE
ncbi:MULTISPECIES: hypothetical protein [Rhizobium]|nr:MULTISPECIES: hypothetical protein [Rhizobium]MCA0800404.1 hypothetical protein [Rhizobium sp. T1473]MCS0458511.1 hypothetical protein [Rhizobium favelukesii]UFS84574.1 hypothetical protein LPB79_28255 [Rhizobium sp. T136]